MQTRLLEIINLVLNNNDLPIVEYLKPQLKLRNDLGMDSINLAELSVRLEDAFGIDFFEKGMIDTVGEIIDRIEK